MTIPPLYLLHPAVVHYPIALLTVGLALAVGDVVSRRRGSWAPPAWETLADHQGLAYWTIGIFTCLSAWRYWFRERWPAFFLLFWVIAAGLLMATGCEGGELVFTHNMGTAASSE
ncbi:MAG: hypothetical protein KGJ84_03945 [Elusimicrobia bacterium]|nr:hypothetical protein [Elusimicrobiota bacterium]